MKKLSIGAIVTAMALGGVGTCHAIGENTPEVYEDTTKPKSDASWDENGGNLKNKVNENSEAIRDNGKILDKVSRKTTQLEGEVDRLGVEFKTVQEQSAEAEKTANIAKGIAEGAATKVDGFDTRINTNRDNITQNTNKINEHETRITNNTIAISTFDNRITQNANDIQVNRENIWENKQSIIKETNERILGDKRTLQESKAYTDSKYGELSAMIEKNKKDTFAGVAAALAASQVPQVTQGSAFSLGAGAGTYQGQTAVAIGMSARFADDVITKLTVTADTQQRIGVGAGYAVEW